MVALTLIASQPVYTSTLIFSQASDQLSPYVRADVILDDGTVGGFYCESTGAHGETVLGKPFVCANGKTVWLRLEKGKYGHVYATDGSSMLGDVDIDSRNYPARWTPDPKKGWQAAKMALLSKAPGSVVAGSKTGFWVRDGEINRLIEGSKEKELRLGPFMLRGVDAKERCFGLRYNGLGLGGMPMQAQPMVFDGKAWTRLPKTGGVPWLQAVNPAGVAIGFDENRAVVWDHGIKRTLPSPTESRASYAWAINEAGDVVGELDWLGRTHACIWRKDKLVDLHAFLPAGTQSSEAVAISQSGRIVVRVADHHQQRLFLLEPKAR